MIGHIFSTGGYDTQGVLDARRALETQYCDHYQMIADKFPNIVKLKTAEQRRTVTVNREDTEIIKDSNDKVIKKVIKWYQYIWVDDGSGMTDAEVCKKYAPEASFIGQDVFHVNREGELVLAEPPRSHTPLPMGRLSREMIEAEEAGYVKGE
jgi:hypothetical protein